MVTGTLSLRCTRCSRTPTPTSSRTISLTKGMGSSFDGGPGSAQEQLVAFAKGYMTKDADLTEAQALAP